MAMIGRRTANPISRHQEAGFTLIELLVVLVLIALGISISAAALRNARNSPGLRPLALQLTSNLRLARSIAMLQKRPVAVILEERPRGYRIEGTGSVKLPDSVTLSLAGARGRQDGFTDPRIIFFPDGSSTGGRLRLSEKGYALTLGVEWLTGAISLPPSG